MSAVTNPGGGMAFWGLLSAAPYPPKPFEFGCSATVGAPIALDKATSASYLASHPWVESYQFWELLFEDGSVVVLGTETSLAPTPVINFPCGFRLLPSGLGAPLAQFGGEITAGSLHTFFLPCHLRLETLGTGSIFLSFGQRLALGQE